MLGGGMRQAGILGAAALYAVHHHRQRMSEDHANARQLAEGLLGIDGITMDAPPQTNIVRFRAPGANAKEIVRSLRDKSVLLMPTGPDSFRAVTHLMITAADINTVIDAIANVLSSPTLRERRPRDKAERP